jgi:predicted DNA-binding transcriptional regulator AlpA
MGMGASNVLDRALTEQQLDLGLFDHLLERMPILMRVDQVSAAIGWKRSTIYALCEEGLLQYHTLPGRERETKLITRHSVALLLLRTASYEARDCAALLKLILPPLTPALLRELQLAIATELTRKTPKP